MDVTDHHQPVVLLNPLNSERQLRDAGERCFGDTCSSIPGRESLGAFDVGCWDYDGYAGRS
jgi:hypothetical protein